MKWWRGVLGLDRDGADLEVKDTVRPLDLLGRQDRNNLVTNRVTLVEADDTGPSRSDNALGLSATWACVNLIAGTNATLPCMVYRTGTDGVRTVARDHPLFYVLHDSPNFDQTAVDFWELVNASIELQGNAYAAVDRRGDRSVIALRPLRPDAVSVRRGANGLIEYEWTEGGRHERRQADEMLHVRGPLGGPLGGLSTLAVCRKAFAGATFAERAAAAMFRNGIRPSGAFSTDKDVTLTKEQRDHFRNLLADQFMGAGNVGRPLVLDRGLTWSQIDLNPEDAQMLESRKFSGEEICRIFGVPPAMVGYGDKASNWGTGKEVDVLGFIKFTLRRRLKRIEQALAKQLLTTADRLAGITIEFNLEGLLRGDSTARAGFYQSALTNGWMTINEVRGLENMTPVEGGEVPRMQMQNVPITEADGLAAAGGQ